MMDETAQQSRPEQLKALYIRLIDQHLDDLINNRAVEMYEIENFAEIMCVHPTHLSNTIKELTGTSPCGIYQTKIMEVAQQLLANPAFSIRQVAFTLTFEPSQFTKWFKRLYGITPKQYRIQLK